MKQTERLYLIDRLLRGRGFATFNEIQQQLEVSRATVKRDLAFLRDRLNVPIVFDRDLGGYRIDKHAIGPRHELPGLWFDDDELLALLSIHQMICDLDVGGVLSTRLRALTERLQSLLSEAVVGPASDDRTLAEQLNSRVRFARMHDRLVAPEHFAVIARALLERRRLELTHYSRQRDQTSERQISPQRLLHYRNAWYLDAWCHWRDDWRTFALDAMRAVIACPQAAVEPSTEQWDQRIGAGYGIFTGPVNDWARLLFDPSVARWVRDEQWHAQQEITEQADGSLILTLPYSDSTELEMDILRHADRVTVLGPARLVDRIRHRLAQAVSLYEGKNLYNSDS